MMIYTQIHKLWSDYSHFRDNVRGQAAVNYSEFGWLH